MNQDIGAMWDEHLSNELKKHEESKKRNRVCICFYCLKDLYKGDEAYWFDYENMYICEDCAINCKVIL